MGSAPFSLQGFMSTKYFPGKVKKKKKKDPNLWCVLPTGHARFSATSIESEISQNNVFTTPSCCRSPFSALLFVHLLSQNSSLAIY
jgi:hypothetical protein